MKSLAELQHYGSNATNNLLDQNYLYKQEKSLYSANTTSSNYLIDETKSSMFIPTMYSTNNLTSSSSSSTTPTLTLPNTLQSIDNDLCKSYMAVNSDQFCTNTIVASHLSRKMKKMKNSSKKKFCLNLKLSY